MPPGMSPGMYSLTCLHKLTRFVIGGTNNDANCCRPVGVGANGLRDLRCLANLSGSLEIKV